MAQVFIVTGVAAALWITVLATVAALRFGGDLRGFLFLGNAFPHPKVLADAPRYGEQGYDGQFYAALATDPLMLRASTRDEVDAARYRGLHILVPLVAWLAGATQGAVAVRIYQVLCWLLAVGAVFLAADWLRERERSPWWALLLVPNAGLATSIMRSTPDAGALALALAALWAYRRQRMGLATAAVVAAALTRESMILVGLALAYLEYVGGRVRRAVWFVAAPGAALGVVMLWRLFSIPSGPLLGHTYGVPFAWVLDKINQMLAANIKITSVELWGFLALIAALAGLAAFGRAETGPGAEASLGAGIHLGAEELTFLLFVILSWTFSFAVYVDVYGYTRVLMPLPFLALLMGAAHEDKVKQAVLLAVPAAFAFVGLLMIRAEIKAALLASHG